MSELTYHLKAATQAAESLSKRIREVEDRENAVAKQEKKVDAMFAVLSAFDPDTREALERYADTIVMGLPILSRTQIYESVLKGLKVSDEFRHFQYWQSERNTAIAASTPEDQIN